jgi:hypothetical protein
MHSAQHRRFWGLELDLLWPLVILAGFGVYVSLVPQPPNDYWWHLKIGELVYTTGRIPTANLFAWTLPADAPFFYGAWLGQYLLYLLYRWGGVALSLFVRTVMVLAAFWLMTYRARLRSGSWRLAALALALAAGMSLNNLIVRPQIWSWLPFMLFLFLLERYAAGRLDWTWLLLLPAAMAFWVNVHGAFILGLVLLGLFGFGELLRTLLRLPEMRTWPELGRLAGVGLLTGLATFANPKGLSIVDYVVGLMTDPPSQQLVGEWQSPAPTGIPNTVFYVSILLLLFVLAYSRYRLTPTDVLLIAGFLWLAWNGQRYVIWYGWVVMPLLAQATGELPIRWPNLGSRRNWLNLALALFLFVPVLLVQPWWVEWVPLPDTYWSLVWRDVDVPLQGIETPIAATEYLREHPGGQLFNEMGYGSYLIWALPEQGVFIDPRVELYPYEQWLDYVRVTQGTDYADLFAEYGVDRVLLDRALQPELSRALAEDPLWFKEYEDDYAQIWSLRSP